MKCDEDKGRCKTRQGWQQAQTQRVKRSAALKYSLFMRIGMGLDGGGTKTDCVLMDDAGRIVGCGRGAASNPSRIGVDTAAKVVIERATAGWRDGSLGMAQVSGLCAGLRC